jgi:ketosteroid isomerase-like protein
MLAQTDSQLLFQLDKEWNEAIMTNQPEKAASYFSDDGQIFVQNGPILSTPAEIRNFVSAMHAKGKVIFSAAATKVELSASGDMGYLTGQFRTESDGVLRTGKYVTIWKKHAGLWKIVIDIFNSD